MTYLGQQIDPPAVIGVGGVQEDHAIDMFVQEIEDIDDDSFIAGPAHCLNFFIGNIEPFLISDAST